MGAATGGGDAVSSLTANNPVIDLLTCGSSDSESNASDENVAMEVRRSALNVV